MTDGVPQPGSVDILVSGDTTDSELKAQPYAQCGRKGAPFDIPRAVSGIGVWVVALPLPRFNPFNSVVEKTIRALPVDLANPDRHERCRVFVVVPSISVDGLVVSSPTNILECQTVASARRATQSPLFIYILNQIYKKASKETLQRPQKLIRHYFDLSYNIEGIPRPASECRQGVLTRGIKPRFSGTFANPSTTMRLAKIFTLVISAALVSAEAEEPRAQPYAQCGGKGQYVILSYSSWIQAA
ncbi:hypothetical protein BKA70DRAFT_1406851 [Coprinopsis sp. MPI-PUGE-AT-0042]|nr:hypothetical protein BKA70DRAFT_1406851 [Coprinopsis sp. MPI-PUGE-AT-0042]